MAYSRDDYVHAFLSLLPQGWAWPRDPSSVLYRTVRGLVGSFEALDTRADAVLRETNPATTLELLPEWEQTFGLPDPCIGVQSTIRARQVQVAARAASVGGQTPDYYRNVARMLGNDVVLTEYTIAYADHQCCDQPLVDDDTWANVFRIDLSAGGGVRLFRTGHSVDGERLRIADDNGASCVFARIKPAHTDLHINLINEAT